VGRIDDLKTRLQYVVGETPKRWQGLLRRSTFARAIRGSNSIEGYDVTLDDAIAAAEGEAPLDASTEAWAAVQGYRTAMTYVLQLANDPHFRYSTDLIRSLHFMMIQHDLTKNPGKWRPGPIYVRDEEKNEMVYEGPDAGDVPSLMGEFVMALNADAEGGGRPPFVRAALGHLNLVMIHPFADGNGRMARCLQTLMLARTGTLAPQFSSIEEYLGRNTRAYYDVLAEVGAGAWHPDRDTRPWVRFCLRAHFTQATTLLRRSREIQKLWDLLEAEIARHDLPERVILALADAAAGYRVRNATYRPVAEISDQLASRDLKMAVDRGFLVPKGERRGRYYEAAPRLRAIRAKTKEPKKVEDPFMAIEAPLLPGLEAD
jgi:Fic family protein